MSFDNRKRSIDALSDCTMLVFGRAAASRTFVVSTAHLRVCYPHLVGSLYNLGGPASQLTFEDMDPEVWKVLDASSQPNTRHPLSIDMKLFFEAVKMADYFCCQTALDLCWSQIEAFVDQELVSFDHEDRNSSRVLWKALGVLDVANRLRKRELLRKVINFFGSIDFVAKLPKFSRGMAHTCIWWERIDVILFVVARDAMGCRTGDLKWYDLISKWMPDAVQGKPYDADTFLEIIHNPLTLNVMKLETNCEFERTLEYNDSDDEDEDE